MDGLARPKPGGLGGGEDFRVDPLADAAWAEALLKALPGASPIGQLCRRLPVERQADT